MTYHDRSVASIHSSGRSTAIAFLLALSAFFGLKGYLGSTTARLPQPRFTAASAPTPALDTIPIEQIRVGQRVLTGAADPDKTLPTAVDQRTWRHLTLEETDTWPDGTVDRISVESLMPPDWLALHDGAPAGSRVPIPLDLEEMGLPDGMTARVTGNEPCPAIDRGPGRVVITTVNHLNPRVVELCLAAGDGTKEEVRPTALHKFYSETRGYWLSAEDLQPGEILRGLTGPLEVVSQRPVPGAHRVYNMTVEGEHVYHVSTLGVLAHNMMCTEAPQTTQGVFGSSVEFDTSELTGGTGFRYRVFQRSDIDWSLVRTTGARQGRGLTNAEAAARHGLAPILPDGSVATLHHSQQSAIGPLFEASTRYHHIGNAQRAPLHPFGRTQNPHYPLGRGAGSLREKFQQADSPGYWKWRGQQEL